MSEHVTLMGAEDVRRAGSMMSAAADQFKQSQDWLSENMRANVMKFEEAVDSFGRHVDRLIDAMGHPEEKGP